MNFDQVLEKLIKKQKIKQVESVVELYLGKNDLESVSSLARFKLLQRVWLNSNKFRNLLCPDTKQSFLKNNFRITELYLQNNDLCDIAGTISHLSCLQTLMLQKNQLVNLQSTLHELKSLLDLQVLNLFDNPLAQEPGYRLLVIFTLPRVTLLDRQEVTAAERKRGREIHNPEKEAIRSSIAFLRRTTANPVLLHTLYRPPAKYSPSTSTITNKEVLPKQKISRTVMQYTTLDWSRVPDSQQRRVGATVPAPQKLTVTIR